MNGADLLDAMNGIEDELVENSMKEEEQKPAGHSMQKQEEEHEPAGHSMPEAEKKHKLPKLRSWKYWKWASAAACLALALLLADVIMQRQENAEMYRREQMDMEKYGNYYGDYAGPDWLMEQEKSMVHIPAIDLSVYDDSQASASMAAPVLVYQGRVYTGSDSYFGAEAKNIKPLLKDVLGNAKGGLDEWSTQDDYAKELASTEQGKVYSMKGYAKDFRLCIEEGSGSDYALHIVEHLNDIDLASGKDLLEDRLHLSENLDSISWQSHQDWNNGQESYQECTEITAEEADAFLEELDRSHFLDYKKLAAEFNSDPDDFEFPKQQVHLRLGLNDGSSIDLRLIKGGYVQYDVPCFPYVLKMSGDAFGTVFEKYQ